MAAVVMEHPDLHLVPTGLRDWTHVQLWQVAGGTQLAVAKHRVGTLVATWVSFTEARAIARTLDGDRVAALANVDSAGSLRMVAPTVAVTRAALMTLLDTADKALVSRWLEDSGKGYAAAALRRALGTRRCLVDF